MKTHSHSSLTSLLALGCSVAAVALASEAPDMEPSPRLPTVNGKDLNGRPWKAPADFPADRTLVILGYEQEQQAAIDTWTAGMALTQPENTLPWVEMPVIDEPGMVMRWIIDTGMLGRFSWGPHRQHTRLPAGVAAIVRLELDSESRLSPVSVEG